MAINPSQKEIVAHTLYSAGLDQEQGARQGRLKHLDPSLDVTMHAVFHRRTQDLEQQVIRPHSLLDMPEEILQLILKQLSPREWKACCLLSEPNALLMQINRRLSLLFLKKFQPAFPNHYLPEESSQASHILYNAQSNFERGRYSSSKHALIGKAQMYCLAAPAFANGKLYFHSANQVHVWDCHPLHQTDTLYDNVFETISKALPSKALTLCLNQASDHPLIGEAFATAIQQLFGREESPSLSKGESHIKNLFIYEDMLYTLHSNKRVVGRDLKTLKPCIDFKTKVLFGACASDGKNLYVTRPRQNGVFIWDIKEGKLKNNLGTLAKHVENLHLHEENLLSIQSRAMIEIWDLNKKQFLVKIDRSLEDKPVLVYDKKIYLPSHPGINTYQLNGVHLFQYINAEKTCFHLLPYLPVVEVQCATIFNDRLCWGDKETIKVWDLQKNELIRKIRLSLSAPPSCLTSFHGKLCAISGEGEAEVFDFANPVAKPS